MIKATELVKRFDRVTALDHISCGIEEGTVYGLVGSNGSGKSTFLRLLSGVYAPDGGEITAFGKQTFENSDVKTKIFFLSDDLYFFHQANTRDMAKFYDTMYAGFDRERFNYLSTVFPIDIRMNISKMSKGMKRQAALMLALSANPAILLLDEAFDGLDPVIRMVLKKLIGQDMAERKTTVIISSHNLREIEDICDNVLLLHKGKVVFDKELDSAKSELHKVQIAFREIPDPEEFKKRGLEVLSGGRLGSVLNLVMRGDEEEIGAKLREMQPLFMELLSPTMEEICMFELEVAGYDVRNILA